LLDNYNLRQVAPFNLAEGVKVEEISEFEIPDELKTNMEYAISKAEEAWNNLEYALSEFNSYMDEVNNAKNNIIECIQEELNKVKYESDYAKKLILLRSNWSVCFSSDYELDHDEPDFSVLDVFSTEDL
jgi:hypothetical protein